MIIITTHLLHVIKFQYIGFYNLIFFQYKSLFCKLSLLKKNFNMKKKAKDVFVKYILLRKLFSK